MDPNAPSYHAHGLLSNAELDSVYGALEDFNEGSDLERSFLGSSFEAASLPPSATFLPVGFNSQGTAIPSSGTTTSFPYPFGQSAPQSFHQHRGSLSNKPALLSPGLGIPHDHPFNPLLSPAQHEIQQQTLDAAAAAAIAAPDLSNTSANGCSCRSEGSSPDTPTSPANAATSPSSARSGGHGASLAAAARRRELLTEEEKKANHIYSEQKRRQNIKVGLDDLCATVPTLIERKKIENQARAESGSRISSKLMLGEAIILEETVRYTENLHQDLSALDTEIERIRLLLSHQSQGKS
ncbi:hypothetical protein IWQ60_008661 [Tieghemiomyces parasiticus]|uniref:BHLH domain-containing protein n=1 Tax=Tieghemiomyces parasiticus TaxID=78921 RepID=A0A9W7ZWX2_9FUNG|nr:hypothetical protein IWQ60_008661 [Tieghemiomyces parasiticus]